MSMFQNFDSFEEMFEEMAKAEAAANRRVTPQQRKIGLSADHRWWMRPDAIDTIGCAVFGECWTEDEVVAREMEASDVDDDVDDLEAVKDLIHDRYQRGYRTGMTWSLACPEGESGDTHVSVMAPLSHDAFALARHLEWDAEAWMSVMTARFHQRTTTREGDEPCSPGS